MAYFVYMVKCSDKTFYIGSTNDVERRLYSHNHSRSGAKYTKGRRPVKLVYTEDCRTKSRALKREYVLKQLRREQKMRLFSSLMSSRAPIMGK